MNIVSPVRILSHNQEQNTTFSSERYCVIDSGTLTSQSDGSYTFQGKNGRCKLGFLPRPIGSGTGPPLSECDCCTGGPQALTVVAADT